jgi:hypothetical protein
MGQDSTMRARERSLETARRRVREAEERLRLQEAVVAGMKADGRPTEVAEMLAQAYREFLKHARRELEMAEAQESRRR